MKQILLVSTLGNVQRRVWRICILILGSKSHFSRCEPLTLIIRSLVSQQTCHWGVVFRNQTPSTGGECLIFIDCSNMVRNLTRNARSSVQPIHKSRH